MDNKMLMLLLPALMGKKGGDNGDFLKLFSTLLGSNCDNNSGDNSCKCGEKPVDNNKLMLEMLSKLLCKK